jgi:hypothetical protein
MGMTKKLYMDWCEQNDINAEQELANDMAWTAEFETWLDKLSSSSPLSEKQMVQLELNFNKEVRHD